MSFWFIYFHALSAIHHHVDASDLHGSSMHLSVNFSRSNCPFKHQTWNSTALLPSGNIYCTSNEMKPSWAGTHMHTWNCPLYPVLQLSQETKHTWVGTQTQTCHDQWYTSLGIIYTWVWTHPYICNNLISKFFSLWQGIIGKFIIFHSFRWKN